MISLFNVIGIIVGMFFVSLIAYLFFPEYSFNYWHIFVIALCFVYLINLFRS